MPDKDFHERDTAARRGRPCSRLEVVSSDSGEETGVSVSAGAPVQIGSARRIVEEFVDELLEHLKTPHDDKRLLRASVTLRFRNAVTAGLAALADGAKRSSTNDLVRDAAPVTLPNYQGWTTFGGSPLATSLPDSEALWHQEFNNVLRELPDAVLRSLLASFHPTYRTRVHWTHRETFQEFLTPWIAHRHHERVAVESSRRWDKLHPGEAYPAAKDEQLAALAEKYPLKRAEEYVDLRWDTKHQRVLGSSTEDGDTGTLEERLTAAWQVGKLPGYMWRKECRKHGIRGCSACATKRRKDRPALERRLRELATVAGYDDLAAFTAKAKRGRPTAIEQARLTALAQIAKTLHDEGWTLESIGAALGGRDRRRVHDLLAA